MNSDPPLLFPINQKLFCWDLFKCLTCLLLSETGPESGKLFRIFYFWNSHTLPLTPPTPTSPPLYPTGLFMSRPPCTPEVSVHQSLRPFSSEGQCRMHEWVSVGLSVCLVLQTPSHLAGPLVVLGSGPGMQGMVQWMIRRKFPAAQRKLRNNSVMGNSWKKK